MTGFIPRYPDKQVFLKFSNGLQTDAMPVELEILAGGDRNHTSGIVAAVLSVPSELDALVQHHWQKTYRRYCKGGRALVMKDISFNRPTRQACDESAQDLSRAFNTWLQGPDFRELREKLIEELNKEEQIQFLIQTDDLGVQQLPWPDWDLFQRYPNASIDTTSPQAQTPQAKKISPPERFTQRLRILGIVGASYDLDTASDRALLEALPAELVDVQVLHQPHLHELSDQLWEQTWDMIVFAGHGDTDEAGQGFLELNDQGELLKFNEIWYGLRKAVRSGLQLALFNSCFGLGLLAQNLKDDAQIPHMIVMRDLVPDAIAQSFLKYFLQYFVAGEPIPIAANRARERLQALETTYPCATWLPVIWQNPYALPLGLAVADEGCVEGEKGAIALPKMRAKQSPRFLPVLITCSLLCLGTITFWVGRGSAARWLNAQGIKARSENQFLKAQRLFEWASQLDSSYPQPLYNLGYTHDQELGKRDIAVIYYEQAAALGYPPAIAEHVRLKLLAGAENYYSMLTLSDHCLTKTQYPWIEASCLKNKGWIQFRKQRWRAAERHLRDALDIVDDAPHTHCLLARTLEAQGQSTAALPHWQKTLQQGAEKIDEHDRCMGLAEQRLMNFEAQDTS
ncbi:MAG: CHAT domain-containing tetratricopeptide repeat protein [Spirulinaceae cyanobacterium]